jgi:VPDSG-CTERM motif
MSRPPTLARKLLILCPTHSEYEKTNSPRMKYLAAAVIAASLLCTAPFTRAATIDFGNTPTSQFTTTYTEDNFQFTVVSGTHWWFADNVGNPPSALEAGHNSTIGVGDTISVMQLGGGLFSFAALDYSEIFQGFGASIGVNLIGLVNGVQTNMFANLNSSLGSSQTLNPLFLTPIDELRIVGASGGHASLILDNFVFDAPAGVPDTGSTLSLLGFASLGLVALRRKLRG